MPITFNEATNSFEGANAFGETLAGLDFSVFGGAVTNFGAIIGPVTANSDEGITFTNTTFGTVSKAAGSQYAIDLTGNSGRNITNDGDIFGSIRLGNAWDTIFNSGTIRGQINTGNGKDLLTNQIIAGLDGGPTTAGTITGGVNMGSGDDTVLNTGIMANINLGSGNDTYTVGGFFDGGFGDEFLIDVRDIDGGAGSAGDVRGGAGDDTMTGGASDDKFFGGADDDRLLGNGGRDVLNGQNGNDALFGGAGNDKIAGGAGNDFIDGGDNNDRLSGGNNDDLMFGGQGNDQLAGGNGNDRMDGGAGHDRLAGGKGNDTMEGGQGRDLLIGGDGADVFVFSGNTEQDEIRDFSAGDRIDIQVFFGDGFLTYADIMDNTVFTGGDAIIDLSAIFNSFSFDGTIEHGSVLTVNNVTIADLDEFAFGLSDDIFVVG
ncbi:calcium-binding protein [uncultured Sulfitobacter sp.]|uniref:calcium-binding protein n=1 Tax=uncultured Sulfitobacter sp. TaxID=191468 RepID=UPI00260FE411|nr:calcium-binding protein [uncultured Sulfitobacter sp.]